MTSEQVDILRWLDRQHREKKLALAVPLTRDSMRCLLYTSVRVPVLGTVPAGIPLEAIEDILDWEEIPASWASGNRQYFGLRVKGDSMYPRYLEGDTVILRKETTCESGDDCAVLVNGEEATLKQVMIRGDGSLELRPTNPAYPPRIYTCLLYTSSFSFSSARTSSLALSMAS